MEDEEPQGAELFDKISEDWQKLAGAQQNTINFLNNSVKKKIGDLAANQPEMVLFFNKNLDINRFFIEDSDGRKGEGQLMGNEMPKIEGAPQIQNNQGGGMSSGFADNSDPFEDDLEDALCVFKAGDQNKDILEKNDKLILFYVDLENELIVDRNEENKNNNQEVALDQINESKHPVLFNQYPLCNNHSIMLLFADAGLPQVLSDELLLLMLQLFKVSDKASLRLGYNSLGADCITNNLHFHILYANQMFGDQFVNTNEDGANPSDVFPIELVHKALFYRTTLQHKNKDEINMYNCAVRFGELGEEWPLRTLVLSPDIDETNEDASLEDAQEALSHTAGIVLNYLIDLNIPHNILIADEGMTIYIIPRKFDLLIENVSFYTSFESLCGFVKCKTQVAYNGFTSDKIQKELRENVSVSPEDFQRFKDELVTKFEKEYEGQVIQ